MNTKLLIFSYSKENINFKSEKNVKWTIPHHPVPIFLRNLTIQASDLGQKKHLEFVQGKFNAFWFDFYLILVWRYGTQISSFFTRNWMKLLDFENISKNLFKNVPKSDEKQRPLWAISLNNKELEIWPPIQVH